MDPLLLIAGRAIEQPPQLVMRIDVRDEALGLFRDYHRQGRHGNVPAAQGVAVEATKDRMLPVPVARDWSAAVEKSLYSIRLHVGDVRFRSDATGERLQDPGITFEIFAQAFSESRILRNELREFHAKPPSEKFATSRRPAMLTLA